MQIRVDCYAGYRGEETPRQLMLGHRLIHVVDVIDRWLAPDHRYFKVLGDDGHAYIVRHDPCRDVWTLTFFTDLVQAQHHMAIVRRSHPNA